MFARFLKSRSEEHYTLRASKSDGISDMNGEIISRESIENGGDAEIITLNILGKCRLIGRTSDGVHIFESSPPLAIYIL